MIGLMVFTVFNRRAANNGWSTDNVRSKLGIDRTNPWNARHLVRSLTDSSREFLIFLLFDNYEGQHSCFRKKKKKTNVKRDKLVSEKFPVVANLALFFSYKRITGQCGFTNTRVTTVKI